MKKFAQTINFLSDGYVLKGSLHIPDVKNPPLVVGAHGLGGSKESAKQKIMSKLLLLIVLLLIH